MSSKVIITGTLLLVGLLSQVTFAKKTEILDQDEANSNIDSIAQAVCDITRGADKQISQFSTINRLIQYFHSIGSDHRLAACAQKSLPALEQMQLILTTGNENVCGEAKIQLIESFHRNFVSKVRKYRKEQKANNLSVPKLLRLFYMHYVSAVSATCERAATRDLQAVKASVEEPDGNQDVDSAVDQVGSIFGKIDSSHGYKNMFVLWNFIDSLPLEKDAKLSRYLHQGKVRLVLQMNNVGSMAKIQDECRNKLKPFYERSLFPVIRLADLGFYPESEQLVHLFSSNPNLNQIYTMIQICETFLPLKAIKNDNLKSGQLIVLPTDETAHLNLDDEVEKIVYNQENKVDSLTSIENDNSQKFIKKVKANINSRVAEQNKILRRIIRRFKSESREQTGQFVLSNGSTKEDLESILHESLPTIDESDPLGSLEGDEDGDEEVVVVRKRRGVMKYVKRALAFVLAYLIFLGYMTLWSILAVVKIFILLPILYIMMFIDRVIGVKMEKPLDYVARGLEFRIP